MPGTNTGSARMRDVAALARVSVMTVSRVLNSSANVSEDMRQRVFAAIEQLRYQPNEVARSLREQRTRQIGVIVPYLLDPFFAVCAHVISTIAKQHSYSVVIATSDEDPEAEFAEASRMVRRNVEGLIVIPAHKRREHSMLLGTEFQQLPIVTLDRPVEGSRFDSVLVDNEAGARLATEHLIRLGHKRIAFVGLSDDLYTIGMRHRGYNAAMRKAKLIPQAFSANEQSGGSMTAVTDLLAQKKPPTALFCSNNLVTRQVLHSLQSVGIYPPEGMALVGFDDFDTADLLRPGTTVVCQPVEQMGRVAAETLFARLTGEDKRGRSKITMCPTELVIRGSCGATRGASSK